MVCLLVGLIDQPVDRRDRRRHPLVFGFLWPREPRRPPRRRDGLQPRRRRPARRRRHAGAAAARPRRTSRNRLPRGRDARPRRRDRRAGHDSGARLRARCRRSLKQSKIPVDLGPVDDFPQGQFIDHDLPARCRPSARSRGGRRTSATTGSRGQVSRASRSSPTAARTSAARCSRTALVQRTEEDDQHERAARSDDLIPMLPAGGFGCPCHGGAVRHGGQPHRGPAGARARPLRVLDREREPLPRPHYSVATVDGHRRRRPDPEVRPHQPRPARRRLGAIFYPLQPPALMADARPPEPQADRGARPLPARLARGALRPRRRRQVLPLPEGAARHELDADARLGDADRVPRPGDHRRDPGDVLQARPERRPTRRSSTSRTTSRSAGSCAACTAGARASSSS